MPPAIKSPMSAAFICNAVKVGPISAAARVALSRVAETILTQKSASEDILAMYSNIIGLKPDPGMRSIIPNLQPVASLGRVTKPDNVRAARRI